MSNLFEIMKVERIRPRSKSSSIWSQISVSSHYHRLTALERSIMCLCLFSTLYLGVKKWTLQVRIYLNTKLGDTNSKCCTRNNERHKCGLYTLTSLMEWMRLAPLHKIWVKFKRIEEIILLTFIFSQEYLWHVIAINHISLLDHSIILTYHMAKLIPFYLCRYLGKSGPLIIMGMPLL